MRRSAGLRALSSEHHSALVLARRAAQAAASGEDLAEAWGEVLQRFAAELEPHFRQEEEQLLPALAQAGETALVQQTLSEHAELRSLIQAQTCDADALGRFAARLQAHVRFEERELFAVAQARLSEFSLS